MFHEIKDCVPSFQEEGDLEVHTNKREGKRRKGGGLLGSWYTECRLEWTPEMLPKAGIQHASSKRNGQ